MTRKLPSFPIILMMFMAIACSSAGASRKLIANARDGNLKIIQVLVDKHHVNPNVTDEHGQTPLMLSAERGYLNIVRFLLEKGSDSRLRDNQGRTAFDLATKAGFDEIAELLRGSTVQQSLKR